jgi:hypothetical protein
MFNRVFVLLFAASTLSGCAASNVMDLVEKLNGEDSYKGVIIATTVKDNSNTATPFTLTQGEWYQVQCDAVCYVLVGATAASATLTTSTGVYLDAREKYTLRLQSGAYIQALASSGTANMKVWNKL